MTISRHRRRLDRLAAPPAERVYHDYMMPARLQMWAEEDAVRTIVAWAKELAGGPRDWRAHAREVPRLRSSPAPVDPIEPPALPKPRVRFSPAYGGMAIDTETGGLADSAMALAALRPENLSPPDGKV